MPSLLSWCELMPLSVNHHHSDIIVLCVKLWRTKSAKIIQNFQNYENQINKYMNKLQFIFTI